MKKVISILGLGVVCVIATSCSKEGDIHQQVQQTVEQSDDRQQRIDNSFEVGYVDPAGIGVITYDEGDLADLAACVHLSSGVGNLTELRIQRTGNVYYLRGGIENAMERADFGYALTLEDGVLVYEEGNAIHACTSTAGSASCKLHITEDGTSFCEDPADNCEHQNGGPSYQCDWPWMV